MKRAITYGSFDLFHEGHYRLLKRAKKLEDYLIVGTTMKHYNKSRGKLNVMSSLMDRVEHVKQTGLADQTIIEDRVGQKAKDIQRYGMDTFTVGSDQIRAFDYLKQYYQVVYLECTRDVSSTMLRTKNFPLIRLDVIGYGRIAKRIVPEARYVSGIYVESVYDPKMENARKSAEASEFKFYADNMNEFFNQIDAAYIVLSRGTHYGYVKQSLMAGKHVLCEKPMTLNRKEVEELFGLAKEKNYILMKGIETVYCPGFVQILSIARSGVTGMIKDVEACSTKPTGPILRELVGTQTGGNFIKLISCILFVIIKLLGSNYQEMGFGRFWAPDGVDTYIEAYVKYPYSLAEFGTGLGVKSERQLIISDIRGYTKVTAPWWKTQEFEVCYEDISQNGRCFAKFLGDGLWYKISNFVSTMNGSEKSDYKPIAEESITIAGIVEEFLTMKNNKGEIEDEGS